MKPIALLACLILAACSNESFKMAPASNAKVKTKLAVAKRSNQESKARASEIETSTKLTEVQQTTTAGHIDAALTAILAHNPDQAVQELIAAKTSNAIAQSVLMGTLRNVVSLKASQEQTDSDVVAAEQHAEGVDKEFEKVVLTGAKNAEIVHQGEWAWGAGYFIVGIKRILEHAFWGSLILLGVVAVIAGVAFFVGGPMLKGVMWAGGSVLNWLKTRKQ